ncbi:acyl-CoA dehydrogenase family protein [Streptomyces monticola]|uniref:Acyl-CoA dehydrogenase family protein n=1 Tax=Streptomyces monticola TaxID=2666263 RepID=A0ABW2JX46_9ACTN
MTAPSFGAELFLGRLRTGLLALPAGDPGRLPDTDEQFLARLREFCATEVDGSLIERDDRIPDRVIEGLKDLGAFAIRIPREYGGLGLSGVCYLRALMTVSGVHSALSELLAAHQAIGLPQPLALFGTEEQKREFLPRCVREISAFTLTEPDVGNDPYRVRTTAVLDRATNTYTLNGVKLWVTNGVIADLLVVMARVPGSGEDGSGSGSGSGDEGGSEGGRGADVGAGDPGGDLTAFIVEAESPGVTVEHRSSFLGLRGLENGVIRLHDVTVPAGHRIGAEGAGLDIALAAQDTGRLSLPAVCAAAAKWCLKTGREWARARVQGGRPIGEYDAVAGKLAFIAATAFALEAMVEVTGHHADRGGHDTRLEAELAKLFASEQAWLVADDLMQIRGGRGYETAESAAARGERGIPVERLLRDLRIGRIFDGSTEALRAFLAEAVLEQIRGTGDSGTPAPEEPGSAGPLAAHRRFAADAAAELADRFHEFARRPACAAVDDHQRYLGRLIDIGAELYAMTATCAYADALADHGEAPAELADAFCAQAERRVDSLFLELDGNTDVGDRTLTRRLLGERYTWLEEGVADSSSDGPWIVEPKPGPSTVPNVRRTVPAERRTAS